jgi:ABC-type multidrug transport system ATPase subunit
MNTLQISNVSKKYNNGVKALDKVNLTISNGMFGLLGPNGAGKSTLMRTIAALQDPTEGTLTFNEHNILQEPRFLRRRLGYLPQEFGVYPNVSAEQLLDHFAVLKGLTDRNRRQEQVDALLQQTNLYAHRKQAVSTFSGGMKQRFGIAQALLGDPQLIIVDEPTAGLDPEERNRFHNLLSEIGENVIILLSTHIVEDVRDLCTDMAILANGMVVKQGQPDQLIQSLKGQLWRKVIRRDQREVYASKFNVISTHLRSGQLHVIVRSQHQPAPDFESVEPNLEAVYFTTLKSHESKNGEG